MIQTLMRRAAELAERERTVVLERLADELRTRFGSGTIAVTATGVQVSGRGLMRRWLTDPVARFTGVGR